MTLKVSVDAGHAGFGVTPGKRALDGSMYEWEFNDGCVRHFMDELSKYEDVEQLRVDDPAGKRDVPLSERAQRANNWGANLHISFHGNAGPTTASGIETFVYPTTTAHNRQVALCIHNHIINATGRKNRGLKTADFQILRTTKMEALLIEGGFMTNAEELALMKTDAYRSKVGRAAAIGVAESFGLKRKVEPKPATPQASVVYEAHVESIGWQGAKRNGETAGTIGQALRLEALSVKLENSNAQLQMEGHVENIGWTSVRTNGEIIGTSGVGLRLEAVRFNCTGLNIVYRAHVQNIGWTDWRQNGEVAGTIGQSLRIEAIEIKLV